MEQDREYLVVYRREKRWLKRAGVTVREERKGKERKEGKLEGRRHRCMRKNFTREPANPREAHLGR